jgi:poly(hydroxyalkanoate) depolymerase family esterase
MIRSRNAKRPLFGVRKRLHTCSRMLLIVCGFFGLLPAAAPAHAATTVEVSNFGSNPGGLRMFKHIPDRLSDAAPLVVVLHGCRQAEPTFANESGWIQLADKLHLALVMPAQVQANNSLNCFNWFQPANATRGKGEALSIKQMIDKMQSDHNIDPKRIYVTGLSAGGAMTSVMLATYPDVFAAGGIVAGVPCGCAKNPTQGMDGVDAMQCMNTGHPLMLLGATGLPTMPGPFGAPMPIPPSICFFNPFLCPPSGLTAAQLGDFVRQASNHSGSFPKVSIWHGSADVTVSPINEKEEMLQWTNVHGVSSTPAVQDIIKGVPHQAFKDASGTVVVETFTITGMDHGIPIDPGVAADQCGIVDQFVIDANICSTFFIAQFWGLAQ